jgi:hypothetical protein
MLMGEITPAMKLAALYNNASPTGRGVEEEAEVFRAGLGPMTVERAEGVLTLNGHGNFDYLGGRELKIDVRNPNENGQFYDRAYGKGAYQLVLANLSAGGDVTDQVVTRAQSNEY